MCAKQIQMPRLIVFEWLSTAVLIDKDNGCTYNAKQSYIISITQVIYVM